MPVLVLAVPDQLAPAAWAAAGTAPGLRVGYVETAGGAEPAGPSGILTELRSRGLLCGHLSASSADAERGGALTVTEALRAAAETHGWDAAIAGPPALECSNAALSLGLETAVAPRLSGSDPSPRHRGLSRDTEEVLEALEGPVRVPVPEIDAEAWPTGEDIGAGEGTPLDRLRHACGERHDVWVRPAPLERYAASGLPTTTMGRDLSEDRLFFAAALAAGDALATLARAGAVA